MGTWRAYNNEAGERVPSVTTILGKFKDPGPLMWWANQMGLKGLSHRDEAARAATIGSHVHDMIEAKIKGECPDFEAIEALPKEQQELVEQGFEAFEQWWDRSKIRLDEAEVRLVSEEYRFGGMLDAPSLEPNGERTILDWKCANGTYPEYILQLAAYRQLWQECRGETINHVHLIRVGKDHGDFHHHYFPKNVLEMGWTAFLHMRELYDIMKTLDKVAK